MILIIIIAVWLIGFIPAYITVSRFVTRNGMLSWDNADRAFCCFFSLILSWFLFIVAGIILIGRNLSPIGVKYIVPLLKLMEPKNRGKC